MFNDSKKKNEKSFVFPQKFSPIRNTLKNEKQKYIYNQLP